ncbi:NADH-quinone oxidoreductase subunit C [Ferruginibacter sp.]
MSNMNAEELRSKLTELLPTVSFEENTEWVTANIDAAAWLSFAQQLKNDTALGCDFLFCITCIDWKTHLTMVYHLTSTTFRHNIVVKAKLDFNKPEIESVSGIWKTAEFHEREVFEMFGVNFLHHPDLRLLILPDGWEGRKPMLKDFEDPINMIKL